MQTTTTGATVVEHEASGWKRVIEAIREMVSAHQFDTWFRTLRLASATPERVELVVANPFIRDWLSTYHFDVLRKAVRAGLETDADVALTAEQREGRAEPDATPAPTAPVGAEPPPAVGEEYFRRHSDVVLNRNYRFENFVVGPSNHLGCAAAQAVAGAVSGGPGASYNPLFLHGDVGLGKTHLLQAVCHHAMTTNPSLKILYLSSETFVNQFIAAIERGELDRFRFRYREVDMLLIDDIHLLANKERTQEEFFHTFNALYNSDRQIVLSSDSPPQDIPTMKDRLISRFRWGLVAEIEAPGYETRMSILRRKADARQMHVPEPVLQYLAENIETNIRELEGAITKIVGYSQLIQAPIDLEMARTALGAENGHTARAAVSVDKVLEVVCTHFGLRVSDLQGRKRTQSIAFPRQVAMYLVRRMTTLSLEEIGGYFGGRDHSTVLYAVDKVRQNSARDHGLRQLLSELESRVRG